MSVWLIEINKLNADFAVLNNTCGDEENNEEEGF